MVLQHLRKAGYAEGITILKEQLAKVRPQFLDAQSFQRMSYLPGDVSHIDCWHTGCQIPVGRAAREAFGLVATLPASAAHAACSRWQLEGEVRTCGRRATSPA